MSDGGLELRAVDGGVEIPLRVHAGARRTGLAGLREGMLRIEVTTAPERGKANREVLKLLAKALGVAPSRLALLRGETAPQKVVLVRGVTAEDVARALSEQKGER